MPLTGIGPDHNSDVIWIGVRTGEAQIHRLDPGLIKDHMLRSTEECAVHGMAACGFASFGTNHAHRAPKMSMEIETSQK